MILEFWSGQTVLVTGTTGFVGKCLLEKLLRDTQVARIVLVIRPKKDKAPQDRFLAEVASSPIFDRLRRVHGGGFEAFMNGKVRAVGGDITQDGLGLNDVDREFVCAEVQEILNCAANVDFNERIDGALNTNCLGPLRLLAVARNCRKLRSYVHVSTAYVNCNLPSRSRVMELLPVLGIEPEDILKRFIKSGMTNEQILHESQKLLQKCKYPNTYTITKACGEILLSRQCKGCPTAIVRPSIVGSAWKDPVPGWVDTVSAGGAMYLSGGLGLMPVQPGNERMIGDQIPVDLVVNTIIAAAAHVAIEWQSKGALDMIIFHSSTSTTNPVAWSETAQAVVNYWRQCPSAKSQIYCRYKMVSNPVMYRLSHLAQVSAPALALNAYAKVSSDPTVHKKADTMKKVMERTRLLTDTFWHFVNNEWFFDNTNVQRLEAIMSPADRQVLALCATGLVWERYINDFQYGLQRWVLKDEVVRPAHSDNVLRNMGGKPHNKLEGGWFLSDLLFAIRYKLSSPGLYKVPAPDKMRAAVLANSEVVKAIGGDALKRERVRKMVDTLEAKMSLPTLRFMAWLLRKLFRGFFDAVTVDRLEIEALRAIPHNVAVVVAPTHKSYLDFVLVSFVLFASNLKAPHIAAGEDFLNLTIVTWLFRHAGAFFIPRSVQDPVWGAVISAYLQELLHNNQWVEFFVEGSRSRSGKVLPQRLGLITTVVEALATHAADDILVVPCAVSYEGCLEIASHVKELTGETKVKESMNALARVAPGSLSARLGGVHVSFAAPIRLSELMTPEAAVVQGGDKARNQVAHEVAHRIGEGMVSGMRASTVAVVAGVLLRYAHQGVAYAQLRSEVAVLRREIGDRGVAFINPSNIDKDIDKALERLQHLVVRDKTTQKAQGTQGLVRLRSRELRLVLELSFMHNQVVHIFAREAILLTAMHACSGGNARVATPEGNGQDAGVAREQLDKWWLMLREVLLTDGIHSHNPDAQKDLNEAIEAARWRDIIEVSNDNTLRIKESKHSRIVINHGYYGVALPVIETYWAVAATLSSLAQSLPQEAAQLFKSVYSVVVRLYADGVICCGDGVSLSTVRGALAFLQRQGAISRSSPDGKETLSRKGSITFHNGTQGIQEICDMLGACRPPTARALAPSSVAMSRL